MKTLSLLALAAVLTLTAVSVGAQGPRRAGSDYTYEDMNHHFGVPNGSAGGWDEDQAYAFRLKRGERYISVSVADDQEGPVAGAIVQWIWDFESEGAKAGHAGTYVHFCGETEKPVKVLPDIQVEILLKKGTCQDGTPSVPTNGHIFMEFYKKR